MNVHKLIIGILGIFLLFSCQTKPKDSKTVIVPVDHIDLYPKYYNCDDFYEKDQQLECLQDRFSKFIHNDVETHYKDSLININDTLWLQFSIDTAGNTQLTDLSIRNDSLNNDKYREIFAKIARRVPKMEPAIYQDKPVEFSFKLPLIIDVE